MLVAAHNSDLAAAAATGMRTAFVLRAQEYGDPNHEDAQARGRYDILAEDFPRSRRQARSRLTPILQLCKILYV